MSENRDLNQEAPPEGREAREKRPDYEGALA